jgi:3-hydroxybutyryl-CoA dehydrogenase
MQVAFWGSNEQLASLQTHSFLQITPVTNGASFFTTPAHFYFIGQTFAEAIPSDKIVVAIENTLPENTANIAIASNWPNALTKNVWELKGACTNLQNLLQGQIKILAIPNGAAYPSNLIISMIVNEAYFALQDGVSTKAEIDLAMQLGAGYPLGPFTWAQQIGLKNIYHTLQTQTEPQYQPCALMLTDM